MLKSNSIWKGHRGRHLTVEIWFVEVVWTSVFPFLLGIVPFRSVLRPRSSSRTERKNGTERNGTISVLGGTERNDENRRNDETGRSVPKLALQEKWMENPLKCVKNPNFLRLRRRHRRRYILRISFKKIKGKNFKKWSKYGIMDAHN